ncbi:PKD domain-containing protein [Desulfocurvibacter africanus]|uniref:RCC1 domain-containing protein n=1 Tax=Desulfocurvibacter africanus TaxID=873 RepID=UPI0004015391|nr:PKD domain-containing protein [Desulfocurvibacter africanus]
MLRCFMSLLLLVLMAWPCPSMAQKIGGGPSYTIVLRADGTLWTWGYNNRGQLGDGTTTQRNKPAQVTESNAGEDPLPARFKAVAADVDCSMALAEDGSLWSWGWGGRMKPVRIQSSLPPFKAMSVGFDHTLALAEDGTLWAWGYNYHGQLGDGTKSVGLVHISRSDDDQPALPARFVAVAASGSFSMALAEDGSIWNWGKNNSGQLGDGTVFERLRPRKIIQSKPGEPALPTRFKAIAAGAIHCLALAEDGKLWGWGDNAHGQLGEYSPAIIYQPIYTHVPGPIAAVAAGSAHSLALLENGTLRAWGNNYEGQLGDGTEIDRVYSVQVTESQPGQPALPARFTAVTAGASSSMALAEDGTLWAWGDNSSGELGDGGTADRTRPVRVVGPDGNGSFDASLAIFPHGAQGEAPLSVAFLSFHTPLASAASWDFGDGQTSSDATPSHTFDTPGLYTVTFTEDVPGGGTTSRQSTTIPVLVLHEIIAEAGPDKTVDEGTNVTLNGTASSDPPGLPLSCTWTKLSGPDVMLTGANTASPRFIAPQLDTDTQVLTFQLTVRAADGRSTTDTVTVTVRNVNRQPTANTGADQTVAPGATVTLDGRASSDPDGGVLTYSWIQISGASVSLTGANTAQPRFTAPSRGTTLTFTLTVTDPGGLTSSDTVNVIVNTAHIDYPPVANAGPDKAVLVGAAVFLDGRASSDPNGDSLTFSWTQASGTGVLLTGANTAQPSFTAPAMATTLTFILTVTDPGGLSSSDTVNVIVNTTYTPYPPVANAGADRSVATGATVALDGRASSDPNGDALIYSWAQIGGTGVSLTGANTAQPRFTAPDQAITLSFTLTVRDPGGLTDSDTVTVTVTESTGGGDGGGSGGGGGGGGCAFNPSAGYDPLGLEWLLLLVPAVLARLRRPRRRLS